jgi:LemA protein
MSNGKAAFWIAVAVIAFAALYTWSAANGLIGYDEEVNQSYAQVQNVMQRQADLIPNLVEAVKGYAGHENKTLTQVAEARGRLSAVAKMDPAELAKNPDLQKQLIEAQAQMNQAMLSINAVREAYPQLQANENFRSLMVALEGSQNRITTERMKNQQAVQRFNMRVRSFPRSVVAHALGYAPRPYFTASAEAQVAPKVKF